MVRRKNREPSLEATSEVNEHVPMEEEKKAQQSTILFRETELLMLETLINSASLKSAVFVNGGKGCGKTCMVQDIVSRYDDPVVYVDCRFHDTEAHLMADIYSKLSFFPSLQSYFNKAPPWRKVLDMQRNLKQWSATTFVVVLDGVERVATVTDFLPALMRSSSISPVALRLILISRHPWQNFLFGNNMMPEVIQIQLRSYTKDELVRLVLQVKSG